MTNPQIINTLEGKRQHLEDRVCWLEKALEQARADLSHIAAVVRLYEAPEAGEEFPTHMNLIRLFARWETAHDMQRCFEGCARWPEHPPACPDSD